MLCCVSRKAAAGADGEHSHFGDCQDEALRKLDEAVLDVAAVASSFSTLQELGALPEKGLDFYRDAQPEVLQPCAVCRRKFNPRSLEKHVKICERTAARKRKPFDSAWQRIQGTELAEFLPKQHPPNAESRRPSGPHFEDRPCHNSNSAWKQSRDEFLRAIRAARGYNVPSLSQHHQHQHGTSSHSSQATHQRPSTLSLVTSPGAPMRSNEKGQCPTCQRQFGVKSYERHVAFCKERSTRLPVSPQISNNVAKERLEARIKYRAPVLRNKRTTTREKYSPGSQKTISQSPLLARTPMKETSLASAKSNGSASPKLPMLKRTGQVNKESLTASSRPLKSRSIDRSNSQSVSRDSSNPPTLRQLFAPRRLLLLTDVFPTKILQSKKSQSSSPSRRSSAKLVTNFLEKEFVDSPGRKSVSSQRQIRKKNKLKNLKHEKKQNNEENEEEQRHDFVTWKQIREDTGKNNVIQSVDHEGGPIFSSGNGLSSTDEENFIIDEFELNKKKARCHHTENSISSEDITNKSEVVHRQLLDSDNEEDPDLICSAGSSNLTLNQIYFINDVNRLQSSPFNTKKSSCIINIDVKNNDDNYDSDDGTSTYSMKTFRKSDNSNNNFRFVDSLDLPNLEQNSDTLQLIKNERTIEGVKYCEVTDDDSIDKIKNSELLSPSKKVKEQLLSIPIKCNSMPNITETKVTITARTQKVNDQKIKYDKTRIDRSIVDNCETKIAGNLETKKNATPTNESNGLNRRCATYVIDERRDSNNRHQHQQQQRANDDSSEEKPLKKRRKLQQRSVDDVDNDNTDDHDDHNEHDNDNDKGSSKNETQHNQIDVTNNVPEKLCPLLNENKATHNSLKSPQKTFVGFDYYRNKATDSSNMSSARTNYQQTFELDEEFDDDNDSNASELIKEIDVNMLNSDSQMNFENIFVDYKHSYYDLASNMNGLKLSANNSYKNVKTERNKKTRLDGSLIERNEETWVSTLQVSDLPKERVDKSTQHFEKEICTITRFDSIARDESLFPSIGDKLSPQTHDWKERIEYHREKLVKSKSKSRVLELEKLKEDDKETRMTLEQFPSTPACPPMRKLMHLSRSVLRRSFERLPRTDWNSYGCRHPDFSMILRDRIGIRKDYDPFLLAEQQLNDLFSDTSDQSSTDGSAIYPPRKPTSSPNFSLSHSSAFAKYPSLGNIQQSAQQSSSPDKPQQRGSLIAPPTGFDDPTSSDLTSDCVENHPLSREFQNSTSTMNSLGGPRAQAAGAEREHVLGRRLIVDQSQLLGGGEFAPAGEQRPSRTANGTGSKLARPAAACARLGSAPKPPERKISSSSSSGSSDLSRGCPAKGRAQPNSSSNGTVAQQRAGSEFKSLNGSNLSLSSIISTTDMEIKRSNSLFDELLSTFEDDANSTPTLPSLMTLMRNDASLSLLSSSSQSQNGLNGHHQRPLVNGRINCSDDDDSSSPESVKRQECGGKLSADSAYSSLNRKHSNYGRSTNDINSSKCKMSKFCHECGFKFPDSAKFCCECGVKRLTL